MNGFSGDNVPAYEPSMSKAVFLTWVQGQDRRHELKDGRAIMQAGGTKRHNWISVNFVTALRARLGSQAWAIGVAGVAVEIGDGIRSPDVIVEPAANDGTALSTDNPILLVEILSPSSVGVDLTIKLAEYTRLASLEAYIIA